MQYVQADWVDDIFPEDVPRPQSEWFFAWLWLEAEVIILKGQF